MLTCPICGKFYGYESKICRFCEDYAIRSGLTKRNPSINNLLLFTSASSFGKVEHHNLRIIEPKKYAWNCIEEKINSSEGNPLEFYSSSLILNRKVRSTYSFE